MIQQTLKTLFWSQKIHKMKICTVLVDLFLFELFLRQVSMQGMYQREIMLEINGFGISCSPIAHFN